MPDFDTQKTIWRTGDRCPDCGRETINTDGRYRWCGFPHCNWSDLSNSDNGDDNE